MQRPAFRTPTCHVASFGLLGKAGRARCAGSAVGAQQGPPYFANWSTKAIWLAISWAATSDPLNMNPLPWPS